MTLRADISLDASEIRVGWIETDKAVLRAKQGDTEILIFATRADLIRIGTEVQDLLTRTYIEDAKYEELFTQPE